MVTISTIGDDSGRTWASVRAPIWRNTGFTANPTVPTNPPSSNNWSPRAVMNFGDPVPVHDAGYIFNLTDLRKAFPVMTQLNSIESPSGSFSTAIGVDVVWDGEETYDYYLTLGTGIAQGDFPELKVLNYYPVYPTPPSVATTGYDYETTKAHLLGATVHLTYNNLGGTFTTTVTITADLFDADMFDTGNQGILFQTASSPVTYWYIDSIVLPT